jgi:dolichyl-phosphate-mannose--protein O-mannosyl transferase
MTLILFLAWMAHWLPVELIPPRMATASATVFSLIALGVSFRLTLPKITYLTIADRFGLYATLLVLVSLAVTVVTVRWASSDRKEAAQRLVKWARLMFPVLYGLIVFLTFAH